MKTFIKDISVLLKNSISIQRSEDNIAKLRKIGTNIKHIKDEINQLVKLDESVTQESYRRALRKGKFLHL